MLQQSKPASGFPDENATRQNGRFFRNSDCGLDIVTYYEPTFRDRAGAILRRIQARGQIAWNVIAFRMQAFRPPKFARIERFDRLRSLARVKPSQFYPAYTNLTAFFRHNITSHFHFIRFPSAQPNARLQDPVRHPNAVPARVFPFDSHLKPAGSVVLAPILRVNDMLNRHIFKSLVVSMMLISAFTLGRLLLSPMAVDGQSQLSAAVFNDQTGSIQPDLWKTASGKALRLFSLDAPEVSGLPMSYVTRTHPAGAREDVLGWSRPSAVNMPAFSSSVTMVLQRNIPKSVTGDQSLYLETARRAARSGLSVARGGIPSAVDTRFGRFEVLDIALNQSAEGKVSALSCLAFRREDLQPDLRISGWLCAPPAKMVEHPQLGCFINRLEFSGNDKNLQPIFRSAAQKRITCPVSRTSQPHKTAWLDVDAPLPSLKGVFGEN